MMAPALEKDERTYMVREPDGDFFKSWIGTEWETVKRFAVWTPVKSEAARFTLRDWQRNGYIDLVCGFAGCRLVKV